MKALVVYCHPNPQSFTAAVRDVVMDELRSAGAETRLIDLYAESFDPLLTRDGLARYEDETQNRAGLEDHIAHLEWCDALIFVYPTWWYGLPAMLKGWLDRVFVPGMAFELPKGAGENVKPGLTHITRLGVFTSGGASWWLMRYIGAPGRRTLLRGVGLLCAKGCKTVFAAHYLMDSSSEASRALHLSRTSAKMRRLIGRVDRKAVLA